LKWENVLFRKPESYKAEPDTLKLSSHWYQLFRVARQVLQKKLRTISEQLRSGLSLVILTGAFLGLAPVACGQIDVSTIIQRSVEANAADWNAAPEYDCFERDAQPDGGSKTYEDLMIMGSPYQKLIAVNGRPISSEQQQQEQRKLDAALAKRRGESEQERSDRIANFEKDRKRDQQLMDQLVKAFDFSLIGQQKLDGFDVYVLKATPKRGYRPPNMDTQVLKGMHGKLWIDKKTFQWVRVEAEVIHPVSIEGFVAQVEPGTRFELEKTPIEDGKVWLAKHYSMRAKAKVLFLFDHKSEDDETYFGYRKFAPIEATTAKK